MSRYEPEPYWTKRRKIKAKVREHLAAIHAAEHVDQSDESDIYVSTLSDHADTEIGSTVSKQSGSEEEIDVEAENETGDVVLAHTSAEDMSDHFPDEFELFGAQSVSSDDSSSESDDDTCKFDLSGNLAAWVSNFNIPQ